MLKEKKRPMDREVTDIKIGDLLPSHTPDRSKLIIQDLTPHCFIAGKELVARLIHKKRAKG